MWDASESFIQTGTYWFTIRLMNVRNTRRAMIVPTVDATPDSSLRIRRSRIITNVPGNHYVQREHWKGIRAINPEVRIYRLRPENPSLRVPSYGEKFVILTRENRPPAGAAGDGAWIGEGDVTYNLTIIQYTPPPAPATLGERPRRACAFPHANPFLPPIVRSLRAAVTQFGRVRD